VIHASLRLAMSYPAREPEGPRADIEWESDRILVLQVCAPSHPPVTRLAPEAIQAPAGTGQPRTWPAVHAARRRSYPEHDRQGARPDANVRSAGTPLFQTCAPTQLPNIRSALEAVQAPAGQGQSRPMMHVGATPPQPVAVLPVPLDGTVAASARHVPPSDAPAQTAGTVPLPAGERRRGVCLEPAGHVFVDEAAASAPAQGISGRTSGLPGRTTVVLKNIGHELTEATVRSTLDERGFGGRYDFIRIPFDTKRMRNLGYAFVNFVHPNYATEFLRQCCGKPFGRTAQACHAEYTERQGEAFFIKRRPPNDIEPGPMPANSSSSSA